MSERCRRIGTAAGLLLVSAALAAQASLPRAEVLRDPAWRQAYEEFVPDEALLEGLRQKAAGLRLEVYFAFWCPDSLHHVPPMLRILDGLGDDAPPAAFFAVERKAGPQQKFYVEAAGVERVPTFIVYRDGREIGRIVENPVGSLLEDLLNIVF